MQTKIRAAFRALWQFLTVIPGWPDARPLGRTVYALPLLLPVAALLVLLAWTQFIRGPQIRAARASHQTVLALESEIAALRLECSDEQAVQSAAATARATQRLIQSPEEFAAQLVAMQAAASASGWVATLHASDPGSDPTGNGTALEYRTIRGRLVPIAGNPAAFATLLKLLERLPPPAKGGPYLFRLGVLP